MTKEVVHIIITLNVGGAELMLKRLVEGLNRQDGMKHSVISLTDIGPVGEQLEKFGIEVRALGMRNIASLPNIFFKLRSELKKRKPDIVQTWMYHADFLGGLAAKSLGIDNIIWGIRTTDVKLGRSKLTVYLRKLCALISFYIPKVIVCAADAGRKTHEQVGYDPRKMKVIPNGFDLNVFNSSFQQRKSLRIECGFSDSDIVIGSIGRFNPIKNQKLFIESAALVAKQYPNARFLMIGCNNTWNNIELVKWINQHCLEDKFVLLGERSDIPVCLSVMDIFCLHSKTEGFPNVLGEAMAMGLPCVATDVGDSRVLLGKTGKIVAVEASSIYRGIAELLDLDERSLAELGAQASYHLRDNYSLSKIIKEYSNLYKSIL